MGSLWSKVQIWLLPTIWDSGFLKSGFLFSVWPTEYADIHLDHIHLDYISILWELGVRKTDTHPLCCAMSNKVLCLWPKSLVSSGSIHKNNSRLAFSLISRISNPSQFLTISRCRGLWTQEKPDNWLGINEIWNVVYEFLLRFLEF